MGRLAGKVAIVSGGARGQGASEARLFVEEGASVVVADLLVEEGRGLADELGKRARFVELDVTDEAAWRRAVEATRDAFGRLDVLVNNAGIAHAAPLATISVDDFTRVMAVNATGVFLGMRAATPALTAPGGSIINISSIDGMVGMAGMVPYVASKFAVRGMTKAAAVELGPSGIRVNSIHPGFIETPMLHVGGPQMDAAIEVMQRRFPLGRVGSAEEVAQVALFLASDDSSYCTGAEFVVDGGLLAGPLV